MSTPLVCRSCERPLPAAGLATCPHCGQTLAADGSLRWMELDAPSAATPSARPLPSAPVPNVPSFPSAPPENKPLLTPVEVPVDDFEDKLARIDRRRSVRDRSRARPGDPRRRRTPVEPRGRNWSLIIGITAVLAIVGAGIYSVVATRSARPHFMQARKGFKPRPFGVAEPIEIDDLPAEEGAGPEQDPFAEIRRGFGVVDPGVHAEIRRTFDELGNAIRLRDQEAAARKISGVRFVEQLLSFANLRQVDVIDFGGAARAAEQRIAQTFIREENDWRWDHLEVKRLLPIDARTMKAVTQHHTTHGSQIVTWWLAKRRDGWRVFDYEHVWSVRGTIRHADLLNAMRLAIGPPAEVETLKTLREAEEILNLDDTAPTADRADLVLKRTAAEQVPHELRAGYRWMRSQILQRQRHFDLALAENDKCRLAEPSRPSLDLVDAMLLHDSGRNAEALTRIERFHRNVGVALESLRELGAILVDSNRRPEARDALRKALDDRPDDVDTFSWFLMSIEPYRKEDDVGRRFRKLASPAREYERFAADRKNANDFESLRQLAIEMCAIDWPVAVAARASGPCRRPVRSSGPGGRGLPQGDGVRDDSAASGRGGVRVPSRDDDFRASIRGVSAAGGRAGGRRAGRAVPGSGRERPISAGTAATARSSSRHEARR